MFFLSFKNILMDLTMKQITKHPPNSLQDSDF